MNYSPRSGQTDHHNGFTLVELSIVLVIIGLIIGGVLVGRDLITAATVRSQISQIEKLNASVNTFRSKYGGLPGDLLYGRANELGFYSTGSPSLGEGDGNGSIDCTDTAIYPTPCADGESMIFWQHLSQANLISGNFIGENGLGSTISGPSIGQYFPQAKLGRDNYIIVYGQGGYNFFQIQGVTSIGNAAAYGLDNSITPIEAKNIDSKVDDGLPASGTVRAMDGGGGMGAAIAPTPAASDAAGNCTLTGTPVVYDTGANGGPSVGCGLRWRFN